MRRKLIVVLTVVVSIGDTAWGQTVEKDRRIEETNRNSLSSTVAPPTTAPSPTSPRTPSPLVPQPFESIYFLQLSQKRIAFWYDAAKSLVILLGVDDECVDLNSQIRFLADRRLLPRRLQQTVNPMQPVRKGEAAYLFYRVLQLNGGIALHLFGPTERYALQELVFQGLMSPGRARDLVTGEELVQLATNAAQVLAQRRTTRRRPRGH